MVRSDTKSRGGLVGTLAVAMLAAALVATGCGSANDRTDNADEFREKVTELGHDVRLIPEKEGRPDLVEGIIVSEDGIARNFAFAFGPAPDPDLPPPADETKATWFEEGDEMYYWVDYDFETSKKKRERFYDAAFAVEDTACEVVADRDCGF